MPMVHNGSKLKCSWTKVQKIVSLKLEINSGRGKLRVCSDQTNNHFLELGL